MSEKFIHLHTHSHYSLLNALPQIPDLVTRAKNEGMRALALTDDGNLYGAIPFYKECKNAGIKPIIGVDFYVALDSRFDKRAGVDTKRHRLVLLAENDEGYHNLLKLVTQSHLEGFYYKPRVDAELLAQYPEGLIAIIPSFSGETSYFLRMGNEKTARARLSRLTEIFGKDNVFLEITHHPEIEGHGTLTKQIIDLAHTSNTPLVAAHDVYYLDPEDRPARETLVSVSSPGLASQQNDSKEDLSFISQKQAQEYFKNVPEALANTMHIADRCNVSLVLGDWVFPKIEISPGRTYDEELRALAYQGLERRGLEETEGLRKRIDYELKVIRDKGFSPYLLIVADLLGYAHNNNILTTTRGSAAGSIVSFLIGITNINPLEYLLPFERFLNPERPKAPDIDMDIADTRRDELINYAREKYGSEKVAQIGTFGTMMARGAVRDVTRALGHTYELGDQIAKLIPIGQQGFPMTLERALSENKDLRDLYKGNNDVKDIIEMAQKIEGCARHISVHAAGVVISPTNLTDYVPIQHDPRGGKLITQYDMYSIEDIGLIKFDFLGLKNLSILADVVKRVKWRQGKDVDVDSIPVDDKKTFEMLARGETAGTFQLNGQGMTHFLKELEPASIHDINAMVALYRPGPMESIPEYIRRKKNPDLVTYPDPRMSKYLERSYGLLVYQDDVLLTAINLAGYSWLEADKLRKAMGKKIPAEMAAQKEKFTRGCINNGLTEEKAQELWHLIEPFAAYGFNKAHAASYGRVAYQTSYMKANYPIEYMAALLTADSGDIDRIAVLIPECKRMDIDVLRPDINESFSTFTIVDQDNKAQIRFGLSSIKNFGEGIAQTIINEREKNGAFASLSDFLRRIPDRNLNKKSLEALIQSGALDAFGDRGQMHGNLEALIVYHRNQATQSQDQESLFGGSDTTGEITLTETTPTSPSQYLTWEKELLGLYLSGHPLDKYKDKLANREQTIHNIKKRPKEGSLAVVAGIIEDVRDITTKNGERMAFVRVADLNDTIEIVVFPKIFETYRTLLHPETCVVLKGRVSMRNGDCNVIAEKMKELT